MFGASDEDTDPLSALIGGSTWRAAPELKTQRARGKRPPGEAQWLLTLFLKDSRSPERLQVGADTRCRSYSGDLGFHVCFKPTQGRLSYGET